MSRFGCVTPSEGLDVTDRKACFLSLLAQTPVWLLELRVSWTFLDQYRPQLSGHGYPTQRAANTSRPRSDRFWLLELRVSRHFSTFYVPSVQAMDTQLGARQGRRTPTIHQGRAQRTISAGSLVVAGWERILLRQGRSSQTGNHGTIPPYGRELPPGRTRKGEVDSDSLFRGFRWIPWLISYPPGAAVGGYWTESAVRICAKLGCRGNSGQWPVKSKRRKRR